MQPEFVFILGLSSPPKQPTIGKATPDFHTLVEADKECYYAPDNSNTVALSSQTLFSKNPHLRLLRAFVNKISNTQEYNAIMNNVMFRGTSHKSLMETVTLLYMLNDCPESPKDKIISRQKHFQFSRAYTNYPSSVKNRLWRIWRSCQLLHMTRLGSRRSALRKLVIVAAVQFD